MCSLQELVDPFQPWRRVSFANPRESDPPWSWPIRWEPTWSSPSLSLLKPLVMPTSWARPRGLGVVAPKPWSHLGLPIWAVLVSPRTLGRESQALPGLLDALKKGARSRTSTWAQYSRVPMLDSPQHFKTLLVPRARGIPGTLLMIGRASLPMTTPGQAPSVILGFFGPVVFCKAWAALDGAGCT